MAQILLCSRGLKGANKKPGRVVAQSDFTRPGKKRSERNFELGYGLGRFAIEIDGLSPTLPELLAS
jgi:hypothetical protein